MANICINRLKVTGPPEELIAFDEAVKSDFSDFDFSKAHPMPETFVIPEDGSNHYPEGISEEEQQERLIKVIGNSVVDPENTIEPLTWWEWRQLNWGTNSYSQTRGDSWEEGKYFDTRWSPPKRLLDNVALKFPALNFFLAYFEPGEGFAGRTWWQHGRREKDIVTNDRKDTLFAQIYCEDFGGDDATLDLDAGRSYSLSFSMMVGDTPAFNANYVTEVKPDGTTETRSYSESAALTKLRTEAENGDVEAQMYLGAHLLTGLYVSPADPVQGLKWLQTAAEQGEDLAKIILAAWPFLNSETNPPHDTVIEQLRALAAEGVEQAEATANVLENLVLSRPARKSYLSDQEPSTICIAPYQQPDPDKAARLMLNAYLMPLLNSTIWAIKKIEEAIQLDQINALNIFLGFRANIYMSENNDKPRQSLDKYNNAKFLTREKKYDEAEVSYKEAIALDPLFLWPLNNIAWMRATQADPAARAGKKAVRYAREACIRSNWNCWAFIGTLAAAYAEAGDFEKAVECQRASIALCPESHLAESEEMLKCFLAGNAFVDSGSTPANEAP